MQSFKILFLVICLASSLAAQQPEWCKKLPRAAYSKLERVPISDPWFEIYKIRPGVFAIYEPHQLEEVISYLIIGDEKAGDEKAGGDRALLFDTGMGISNIQAVVAGLTKLPVSVVNSHTHNDHVGDNWRFSEVYGMDTDFTRTNARGSTADAQAELASDELCGAFLLGSTPRHMRPGRSTSLTGCTMATRLNWADAR
jgi:glyoxylase-like metal-dependent hydrolase (beta-lactamase superfamily II)